jgi:hypothetical protein
VEQAEKASADLEAYQARKQKREAEAEMEYPEADRKVMTDSELVYELSKAYTQPIKTTSAAGNLTPIMGYGGREITMIKPPAVGEYRIGDPPAPVEYAVEGVDYEVSWHKAKNGLGQTVYEMATITPIGDYRGGQEYTYTLKDPIYPRPRHNRPKAPPIPLKSKRRWA